jgi:rsbT co-antagonist protein RsbR
MILTSHSARQTVGDARLVDEMAITGAEIERRKEWLGFGPDDVERLRKLGPIAAEYAEKVIEDLYRHFLSFPETAEFFSDPAVLDRVKRMQLDYFRGLTEGDYGVDYAHNRLLIGAAHGRIGLDVKWYLGAYSFYLRLVWDRLFKAFGADSVEALATFFSLTKLVYLDIGLAMETYIYQRERTIQQQQLAIRELSTPVLRLRPGLLLLPIIGEIDTQRARQVTEQMLRAIRANRAKVVVMDVTGVPTVDSAVANHLVQTVEAARLLGASVIVSGLSPDIAQTLVTLGVDLSKMHTVGDLQGGIEAAERFLGYVVHRDGGDGVAES